MKPKKILLQTLSPFGEWQHPKGLQIVDAKCGLRLQKNFNSLFGHFKKIKCPIFIGHPDENPTKALLPVGEVKAIEILEDSIAVLCAYDDDIYEKILKKEIQNMSARWEMKKIKNGVFTPIRLISIGLTNNPNIAGSGKILNVPTEQNLENLNLKADEFSNSILSISEGLNSCLTKIEKLESVRIKKIPDSGKLPTVQILPKQSVAKFNLAELAKERMKDSSLTYTAAFAQVKKEFLA